MPFKKLEFLALNYALAINILKAISVFLQQNQTFHPTGFSRFPSPPIKVKPIYLYEF